MQKQGTIRRWDADRGFGFIDTNDSRQVFFHVRDFARNIDPAVGMQVHYEEIHVGGKGPRAMSVRPSTGAATPSPSRSTPRPTRTSTSRSGASAPSPRSQSAGPARSAVPASGTWLAMLLMVCWVGLLITGRTLQRFSPGVILGALIVNLITFALYVKDKNAAQTGQWRTSEPTLHALSLLGGWPAAWWAQQWLRHKSSKKEFRAVYWATILVHCTLLTGFVLSPQLL